jgi:hypothetical protein
MDHHPNRRLVATRTVMLGALCLATACTSQRSSPTAQEVSAAVGRPETGVAAGPTGGTPIGSGARVGLDDQELHRLLDAARIAFASNTDETTSYTVVPQNIDDEPTGLTARPAGPRESRADGSVCRPIELSATKQGHTTRGTLTFCRAPGSGDLKVAPTI